MEGEILKNREEAGYLLAEKLKKYQDSNSVVLAVPRGGVPVGFIIAKSLQIPLDIILSKKIGHPGNEEYAIGAVSAESIIVDRNINVPDEYIEREIIRLRKALREKQQLYRSNREPISIKGKNVIVVDDGIATGKTLLASIEMLRKQEPAKIIVAAPVIPSDNVATIQEHVDEFVYLIASPYFRGVGGFYDDFSQTEDEEVIRLLNEANNFLF